MCSIIFSRIINIFWNMNKKILCKCISSMFWSIMNMIQCNNKNNTTRITTSSIIKVSTSKTKKNILCEMAKNYCQNSNSKLPTPTTSITNLLCVSLSMSKGNTFFRNIQIFIYF